MELQGVLVIPCELKYAEAFFFRQLSYHWSMKCLQKKPVAVSCGCSLAIMCNHVEDDIFV